jgi:hypothetical protein
MHVNIAARDCRATTTFVYTLEFPTVLKSSVESSVRESCREQFNTGLELMIQTRVHAGGKACACQHYIDEKPDKCDSTNKTFTERCLLTRRHQLDCACGSVMLRYDETRKQESGETKEVARVCTRDMAIKQRKDYHGNCQRECDWKLVVEPFVKLHKLV